MRRFSPAIFSCVFIFSFCSNVTHDEPVEETRFLMDTVVRIAVYDTDLSKDRIQAASDQTFQLMLDLETKMSAHMDTSEISRINQQAGRKAVLVSGDTRDLILQSLDVSQITEGAFDATIGAVKKLWKFDEGESDIPDPKDLTESLSFVNYKNILIEDSRILLQKDRMNLDLGGLAKGYIVDRGVFNLQNMGIRAGIVDAGGDLRIFGKHPKNKNWKIAIQHPRHAGMNFYAVLNINATSIATSGDYERYFSINGKRYHHLLDPKTGYPASQCAGVTIVTKDAMLADAYATAVFIMGVDKGIAWIDSMPDVEGMIIYEENGKLYHRITKGIKNNIEIL